MVTPTGAEWSEAVAKVAAATRRSFAECEAALMSVANAFTDAARTLDDIPWPSQPSEQRQPWATRKRRRR